MATPQQGLAAEEIAMTLSDELSKLAELRERGTLTDEEFTRAKDRLLNAEETRSAPPFVSAVNAFRRSRADRWIAGVCGGIARATGMESWAWRLIFAVLALCGGAGLLLYVLLAIFVPSE
jgi:phage shock protein PspC (stress-responsive transcriptional regulator)